MSQRGLAPILIVILIALGITGYVLHSSKISVLNQETSLKVSSQPTSNPVTRPNPTSTPTTILKIQPKDSPAPTQAAYSSSVKLDSISPKIASSGEEIKLLGSGFGTVTGKMYLYNQILGPSTIFADIIPNRWTDNEIKITIPPAVGGQTIDVEVIHYDGTKSNRVSFQIKGGQPRIGDISPSNAQPLQSIIISGKEFGPTSGTVNIYKTSGSDLSAPYAKCDNLSWDNGSIKCMLPSTVNNGSEYGFEIVSSDNRKSSFKYYQVGS